MFEKKISITFLSDWHVGSGLGSGPAADSILCRDIDGLPILPGRAIKGALREGAWRLGMCRDDLASVINFLWGSDSAERLDNTPARIRVGLGRLPEDIEAWLLARDREKRDLYVEDMTILRAQTALDKNKMVVPHSLRSMECGIAGLCFTTNVVMDAPDLEDSWLDAYLAAVCGAVKSMGAERARGMGLCRIEPLGGSGALTLPPPLNQKKLAILAEAAQ